MAMAADLTGDGAAAQAPVRTRLHDGVLGVVIDNPPVNALSQAVRAGLEAALAQAEGDDAVRAVVLSGAGSAFIAGADIREFDAPPRPPLLPDLLAAIERAGKPWVAAIDGAALGGGLEVAMACAARIASPGARLGLPETTLGLIPGAGGTVRLPRLAPVRAALDLVAWGRPVDAARALELGLIDAVAAEDLSAEAHALARSLADGPRPTATLDRPLREPPDAAAWGEATATVARKARGWRAPVEAAAALEDALRLPAAQALAAERARFLRLKADPQCAALRHIFFAERAVSRLDRLKGVDPRPVARVGVVGGGAMGAGIAAATLLAGLPVTLVERDAAARDAGLARVGAILDQSLKRSVIDADRRAALGAMLTGATDMGALADADLAIEAVFEDMAVKRDVFAALDAATRPDAVLATNTSYLDVGALAQAVRDPSRVIGLHFFSPAHVMKLLEVVTPPAAAPDALATGFAFGKRLRKIAVPAGVCDGFIGNRVMSAYRRACDAMLLEGATPWAVDDAMTGFGFPMGLYAMQDMAGLDIGWATRKRRAAEGDPAEPSAPVADRLCEAGRLGRKAGRGWYDYAADAKGAPDPAVDAIVAAEAARAGRPQRAFDADAIMARILAAMQAEGARIVAEGVAQSPDAVDVVMVNGYGFPRWRGGPMHMARAAGAAAKGETP